MELLNFSTLLPRQAVLWERFQVMRTSQQLPHAFLLIGTRYVDCVDFVLKMASAILCAQEVAPCGYCKSCHLMALKNHPDCYYLQPDKPGGFIKVDEIRDLEFIAYKSPQLGCNRVIVIHPAERMNNSAANALLKLLEEPPSGVFFILIAEQIGTLLPTIISRCQQWRLPCEVTAEACYHNLHECSDYESFVQGLVSLCEGKKSVCEITEQLATFDLNDILRQMYLVTAQLIHDQLRESSEVEKGEQWLQQLSHCFKPTQLFKQLDKINDIMKKLNAANHLNTTLALENLLLSYQQEF